MKPISFTKNGANIEVPVVNGRYQLKYPCGLEKTSCFPYFAKVPPGTYRFLLHGASGGTSNQTIYGSGGYTEGIISFDSITQAYFYVGAEGTSTSINYKQTQSSFNGGGKGHTGGGTTTAGSGGGCTDIRLFSTSLNNRILVAGGGGGTGYYGSYSKYNQGGSGGGSNGMKGEDWNSSVAYKHGGEGGTQISGGSSYFEDGTFGYGADRASANGGGGGGGWFGGGAGGAGLSGGGGGSGFVFNSMNPNISLDSRYFVYKGITRTGTNKGDGIIEIEQLSPILSISYRNHFQINSKFFIAVLSFLFSR